MEIGELILMLSRLGIGAVATFLAILLWSNTRDVAWMLIVMGTILRYGEIMYSTFELFGLVHMYGAIRGIPVAEIIFLNLPTVLFIAGFSVMISRYRSR